MITAYNRNVVHEPLIRYATLAEGLAAPAFGDSRLAWGDFTPTASVNWVERPADGAGLRRAAYGGLRVLSAANAGLNVRSCIEALRTRLIGHLAEPLTSTMVGANSVMQAAWDAAALGRIEGCVNESTNVITRILAAQRPSAAFLDFRKEDNAESWWFCELVILDALSQWWVCDDTSLRAEVRRAVCRSAEFHLHETQPDHATMHPWACGAMMLHPPARPLADWMLGAMQVQFAGGLDAISALLLQNASHLLRQTVAVESQE